MYYTQKPWRAHRTISFLTILGLGISSFTALVAVATLAAGMTPWEVVVVRQQITPAAVSPTGALQVPMVDQLCLTDNDCATAATICNSCTCGDAVNKIYEQKYRDQYAALCANVRPVICDYRCPAAARCINKRCTLSPAH